jgi:hypothetical protein
MRSCSASAHCAGYRRVAQVAHGIPAVRRGEPHRLLARPAQPHRKPVLERSGRDRRGSGDRR